MFKKGNDLIYFRHFPGPGDYETKLVDKKINSNLGQRYNIIFKYNIYFQYVFGDGKRRF